MIKKFSIFLIRTYRFSLPSLRLLFPVNFPCIHFPGCSEYTEDAIKKFGILTGLWMGLKRICSCHRLISREVASDGVIAREPREQSTLTSADGCAPVSCWQ